MQKSKCERIQIPHFFVPVVNNDKLCGHAFMERFKNRNNETYYTWGGGHKNVHLFSFSANF